MNRIALITGGGSGLGRATVERFVRNNFAKVILCDLPSSDGYKLAEELNFTYKINHEGGDCCIFVPTDVTQSDQITEALDIGEDTFGDKFTYAEKDYRDGVVNTVVNCAGIGLARKTISSKGVAHDLDSFEKVLQINTVGTFNVIRLTAERMVKKAIAEKAEAGVIGDLNTTEYGVIINTASIAVYDGQIGQVAYAASKAAIVGMTLPLARDLSQYGIRVNTIAPGLFQTPLLEELPEKIQLKLAKQVPFPSRLGLPSEYAQLVDSIISNSMINGEVIRIDGGIRMMP
jgi:3-hydroxyacyl-CoA dehydrogenase/3-hydroxy-2-methylbutyryl-CoA dehydrogenase